MKIRKRYWQVDEVPLLIIERKIRGEWTTLFHVDDLESLLTMLKHNVKIKKVDMK